MNLMLCKLAVPQVQVTVRYVLNFIRISKFHIWFRTIT